MKTERFIEFYGQVKRNGFPVICGTSLSDAQIVALDVVIAHNLSRLLEEGDFKKAKNLCDWQCCCIHTKRTYNYIANLKVLKGQGVFSWVLVFWFDWMFGF